MKNLFLFILALMVGFVLMIFYPRQSNSQAENLTSPESSPSSSHQFSLIQPPTDSLKGNLTALSGSVSWQSRISTQSAEIDLSHKLQQGELIETGDNSSATIDFTNIANIILSSNSKLSLIQTLPANLVFNQNQGITTYTKVGSIPISIRSLHLLTDINQGQVVILVNPDTDIVNIKVKKGSASLAFTNSKNTTQVINVTSGQQFKFDSDNRQEID